MNNKRGITGAGFIEALPNYIRPENDLYNLVGAKHGGGKGNDFEGKRLEK